MSALVATPDPRASDTDSLRRNKPPLGSPRRASEELDAEDRIRTLFGVPRPDTAGEVPASATPPIPAPFIPSTPAPPASLPPTPPTTSPPALPSPRLPMWTAVSVCPSRPAPRPSRLMPSASAAPTAWMARTPEPASCEPGKSSTDNSLPARNDRVPSDRRGVRCRACGRGGVRSATPRSPRSRDDARPALAAGDRRGLHRPPSPPTSSFESTDGVGRREGVAVGVGEDVDCAGCSAPLSSMIGDPEDGDT